MCLALPHQVLEIGKNFVIVDFYGKKKKVKSLIKIKKGDFVLIQNNSIIKKINKKMAKEILGLLKI